MTVSLEELALSIKRAQHRQHRQLDAKLAPLGITLVQWDALRAISRNDRASSHRLAQLTFQTDQSFGALATRLVERGLIERVAAGRALHHTLTAAGETLLQQGRAVVSEIHAESFAPLNQEERATLYDLLTRLIRD